MRLLINIVVQSFGPVVFGGYERNWLGVTRSPMHFAHVISVESDTLDEEIAKAVKQHVNRIEQGSGANAISVSVTKL